MKNDSIHKLIEKYFASHCLEENLKISDCKSVIDNIEIDKKDMEITIDHHIKESRGWIYQEITFLKRGI